MKKFTQKILRNIKIAYFIDDLQNIDAYKKYFFTEEDAKKWKEENGKTRNDWYKPVGEPFEFYIYENLGLEGTNPQYGICKCQNFKRLGYDDPVTLCGVYNTDESGTETGGLVSTLEFEGNIRNALNEIKNNGLSINGKTYLTGDTIYTDFSMLQDYVNKFIEERKENVV